LGSKHEECGEREGDFADAFAVSAGPRSHRTDCAQGVGGGISGTVPTGAELNGDIMGTNLNASFSLTVCDSLEFWFYTAKSFFPQCGEFLFSLTGYYLHIFLVPLPANGEVLDLN